MSGRLSLGPQIRRDMEDGGGYRIASTITKLGVLGAYRVRLFERLRGRLLRQTWSDSAGNYLFDYIPYRPLGYFVVAFDHGGSPVNAAIADLVTPEPMP